MSERTQDRVYSDKEVRKHLQTHLPEWRLARGCICRKYETHGWKGTLMVINAVGHLAEAAWHHPDITASYAWAEIRLCTHSAHGITDRDFELAAKLEEVVHWQPAKTGGALSGTPNHERHLAYIKYERK
jgi:4a-hydroxytetrahydrobiopterin dehydratase